MPPEKTRLLTSSKILRRPEVEQVVGLSRSTIYAMMTHGAFPQPVKLGARAVGWRESDVLAWLESRAPRNPRDAA